MHLQSLKSRFSHILPPQMTCSWRQWENERKYKGSLDKHNFSSHVVQLKFNYGGLQAKISHRICSYGISLPLSKSQERSREFLDFFQLYWGVIDKYNCKIFKVYNMRLDIHRHCERIPPKLLNTSINSNIYLLFIFLVRAFKYYSLSKFHLYNTVLSTVFIIH